MGLAERVGEVLVPAHLLEAFRGHPPVVGVLVADEDLPVELRRAFRIPRPLPRTPGVVEELAGHEVAGVLPRRALELLGRPVEIVVAVAVPQDVPAGEGAVLAGRIRLGQPGEIRQRRHPVVLRQLRPGHAVERPFPERVFLFQREQFLEHPLLGGPPFQPPQRLAAVVEGLRQQVRPPDPRQGAQRGAQPPPVVLRHPDAQPHQLHVGRRGEPVRDLAVVLVRLPVVPGPREPRGPPHRPRVLLGGGGVFDVPPLVQRRELPPRGKRLRMGRHVVVEDLEGAGGLLPPPQPFERRRLRHQRLPPQREATIGDGRVQMGQRLLPFPGPRQPPPQVEPQPVPLPVLRELIKHPPQQRDPIPPPHPRQAPAQEMQRIRRQLAVRQLGRSQPLLRLRPPPPPQRIATQPVRSRGPSPGRERGVIGNRFQRLLPIRPRLNGRRGPHRRQPIRQFLQRLPRNPGELLGRLPGPPEARTAAHQQRKAKAATIGAPASGRHRARSRSARRRAGRTPAPPHGAPGWDRRSSDRHAGRRPAKRVFAALPRMAPPAWNAGLQTGTRGARRRARREPHPETGLQPRRGADQGRWRPRLGAPASGRHRAKARNPP